MINALHGIKVVDVSQVIAAPIAARHLADFGADVIHVENAKGGDYWRDYLKRTGGVSSVPAKIDYNWEVFNRNKKSVALDLSTKQGQEILYKLVESADIFVTNLRMYEREKFACGYQQLKNVNPKLIYGSVTGFGSKGPEKNTPAFDQTSHWYRSGINYALVPAGVPDIGFRAGFGDTVTGMGLYAGIMTALYNRERTGIGQEVEISLLAAGMYQLSFDIAGALITGKDFNDMYAEQRNPNNPATVEADRLVAEVKITTQKLWEFRRQNLPNPLSNGYITKDNRLVRMSIIQPDRYWAKLCRVLDLDYLIDDPRFNHHEVRLSNHKELYHIVKGAFGQKELKDIYTKLLESNIPFAVKQKISEVIHDPQARANECFAKFEHPEHGQIEILASPMKLSETPSSYRLPAPEFSQHTEETLLELGYSWEDIANLKEKGIIP